MSESAPPEPVTPLTPPDALHALWGIVGQLHLLRAAAGQILNGLPPAESPELFAVGRRMLQEIGGTALSATDMLKRVGLVIEPLEVPKSTFD